jgi:Mg-chelatase subunit ChlD
MGHRRPVVLSTPIVLLAGLCLVALPSGVAGAAEVDRTCTDVEAVFARGSGQSLGDREFSAFDRELDGRLGGGVTYDSYELGTESYGGYQYPAVDVGNVFNGNPIGAKFSSGYAWDYGDSVWAGVQELIGYLYDRAAICSDTQFVLGGYSQGAQVIGQAYGFFSGEMRDRVVFNALFGDPKLYLPEGEGIRPAACRGEELSEWRRTVPNCQVDNGSLGARKPYLPGAWTDTTGLWCADHDFVCGSSKYFWDTDGHMTYGNDGGAVDEAAIEIVDRLRDRLPAERADDLDTSIHIIGTGTTGLDVVFVIDSTGSMGDDIEAATTYASTMADAVAALRGRVALVEYRDAGDEFVARTLSGLSPELTDFRTQLATITADGGGDNPEALLSALMQGFNSLDWRPGATKAAVVLTDAEYHDPDVAAGWTTEQVAARALEIDPVNVYPVVPEFQEGIYTSLAELTSGQVIVNSGDTVAALQEALTRISTRPVALLGLSQYDAAPGEQLRFEASDSYVADGEIVEYAWDFDGDGTFEEAGGDPVATHTYAESFDGVMQVRVTAADGGVASASAVVRIAMTPAPPTAPGAPEDLAVEVLGTTPEGRTNARLTWSPADALADRWGVSVNGVPVGLSAGNQTVVELTDLDRSADVELTAVGLTAEGELGTPSTVILPADDGSSVPPPTTATPTAPSPSGTTSPAPASTPTVSVGAPAVTSSSAPPTAGPAGLVAPAQASKRAESKGLASTGAVVLPLAGLGVVLVGAGLLMAWLARRRRG